LFGHLKTSPSWGEVPFLCPKILTNQGLGLLQNAQYHLDELEDTEDLQRAVARKDVLFYHFAMDIAIDHFLQALFAINRTYFPSRKRTLDFIEIFNIKPERCNEKLLEVIKLGSFSEGINQSFTIWSNMVNELKKLSNI